jgi:hypothetical protein
MSNYYNLEKVNEYRLNDFYKEAENERKANEAKQQNKSKEQNKSKKPQRRPLLGFLGSSR